MSLQWPKRDVITWRLLPSLNKKLELSLLNLLKTADAVAINCDIWSSKRQRGYLGVSAHFIDKDFTSRHVLLACPRFSGTHDADKITEIAVDILTKFELETKVCYIGTDNGANIISAFKDWFPGFIDLRDQSKLGNYFLKLISIF